MSKPLAELSDRQLLERNYAANIMLFEKIQKLKKEINLLNTPTQTRSLMAQISRNVQDYNDLFEKELDEYISKKAK
jgi:hypothetical protein